jgi:hypothetical protein
MPLQIERFCVLKLNTGNSKSWSPNCSATSCENIAIMFCGEIGKKHAGEHIPHLHLDDKTNLSLTEEMTFAEFVRWLKSNLQ